MSSPVRRRVFLAAGAGLAALLLWSFAGLPDFGHYLGPYGRHPQPLGDPGPAGHGGGQRDQLRLPRLRHARGGVHPLRRRHRGGSLLRELRGERNRRPRDDARGRRVREPSVAVTLMGLALVGPTLVLGLYIVDHGHQTPGGGFQGGVILATALLLVFLADQYVTLAAGRSDGADRARRGDRGGAFALIGVGGMIWAGAYFANFLGVGRAGMLLSGGIVLPGSVAVGLAVTGGFAFMLSEFLEQTLVVRRDRRRRGGRARDDGRAAVVAGRPRRRP